MMPAHSWRGMHTWPGMKELLGNGRDSCSLAWASPFTHRCMGSRSSAPSKLLVMMVTYTAHREHQQCDMTLACLQDKRKEDLVPSDLTGLLRQHMLR